MLIIHGDEDNIVPLEYSQKADKIYKNSKLKIFHGEGHGFSDIANRQTIRLLIEFINKEI